VILYIVLLAIQKSEFIMKLSDSLLNEPEPGVPIRRYMSLEKLIYLLSESSLYFSRSTTFNDPWEGIHSIKAMKDSSSLKAYVSDIKEAEKQINELNDISIRNFAYASCWSTGYESALLWDARWVGKNSVAVESSVSKLENSISASIDYYLAYVDYVPQDEILTEKDIIKALYHKRFPFRHEEEVRIVLFDTTNKIGVPVEVSIKDLISHIVVSPMADALFYDAVSKIAKQYLPETYSIRKSQVYTDIWKRY